eukprot:TRINITY_DN56563_c0_g1_i1.p1 TRINITY_DN56563_c0_g1~~TRINITY_DN56563_c0_g1_i1.p1  ORF type:complete len:236 (+),score=41.08 TRINITY_DN56563_c0_g1_i1:62-769(+)
MPDLVAGFLPRELVALAMQALNYAMLIGGSIVKLPQVVAIVRTGTVKGMSETSIAVELVACLTFCSYNFVMGHPFRTWGEMAMITIQCGLQMLLFWRFADEPLAMMPRALCAVVVVSSSAALVWGVLPESLLPALGLVPTVLGAIARVPQIIMNFQQHHTGNQSIITWGMSMGGNAVRILTTLAALSDPVTLLGHVVAFLLNFTLVGQIVIFWKKTQEVVGSERKKKADSAKKAE